MLCYYIQCMRKATKWKKFLLLIALVHLTNASQLSNAQFVCARLCIDTHFQFGSNLCQGHSSVHWGKPAALKTQVVAISANITTFLFCSSVDIMKKVIITNTKQSLHTIHDKMFNMTHIFHFYTLSFCCRSGCRSPQPLDIPLFPRTALIPTPAAPPPAFPSKVTSSHSSSSCVNSPRLLSFWSVAPYLYKLKNKYLKNHETYM